MKRFGSILLVLLAFAAAPSLLHLSEEQAQEEPAAMVSDIEARYGIDSDRKAELIAKYKGGA